jgi:hypothetical protein
MLNVKGRPFCKYLVADVSNYIRTGPELSMEKFGAQGEALSAPPPPQFLFSKKKLNIRDLHVKC